MLNTCGSWLPYWVAQNIPTPQTSGYPSPLIHTTTGCRWHLHLLQCWARPKSGPNSSLGFAQILQQAPTLQPVLSTTCQGDTVWKPSPLTLAHPPLSSTCCHLLPHPPHTCLQSKAGRICLSSTGPAGPGLMIRDDGALHIPHNTASFSACQPH